jgi:serine/threonine-protein kinase RsbT
MNTAGVRLAIGDQSDVEEVRREARRLASALDFSRQDCEVIALAVSELASNLLRYASGGEIEIAPVTGSRGVGIQITSLDHGPGIVDVDAALRDGFSTSGGLGGGLGGVQRLLDEFDLSSSPGGTLIVCRKWIQPT